MSRSQDGYVVTWASLKGLRLLTHSDQIGKLCIEVKSTDKIAFISEILCIGCGICVKKCVFTPFPLHTVSHICVVLVPEILYNHRLASITFRFRVDVLSKPSPSSTSQRTWSPKSLIDTPRTPSSFIGCPLQDPAKCLVLWARTVLERAPL